MTGGSPPPSSPPPPPASTFDPGAPPAAARANPRARPVSPDPPPRSSSPAARQGRIMQDVIHAASISRACWPWTCLLFTSLFIRDCLVVEYPVHHLLNKKRRRKSQRKRKKQTRWKPNAARTRARVNGMEDDPAAGPSTDETPETVARQPPAPAVR